MSWMGFKPMSRTALLVAVTAATLAAWTGLAKAADLPARVAPAAEAQCGPCGCLRVTYATHRELRSTYGAGFDPRNFDESTPYFYFGAMRRYPRYSVDGAIGPGYCVN
jgi:hypothetical protein